MGEVYKRFSLGFVAEAQSRKSRSQPQNEGQWYANGVGLAAGAALNFVLQRKAFAANLAACHGGVRGTLIRYWTAECIIVSTQQSLFVLGLRLLRGEEPSTPK